MAGNIIQCPFEQFGPATQKKHRINFECMATDTTLKQKRMFIHHEGRSTWKRKINVVKHRQKL